MGNIFTRNTQIYEERIEQIEINIKMMEGITYWNKYVKRIDNMENEDELCLEYMF